MKYKNIEIKWLGHSGFFIKCSLNIYIDPFKLGEAIEENKADIILITHGHYDHFSVEDIKKIIKPETKLIGPSSIIAQTRQVGDVNFEIAEIDKTLELGEGINVKVVPFYNINKQFHPKEESNVGYIIDINGTTIYHAGDSDFIPEMKDIHPDIALLPVSGKFTMDSNEAAKAALIIKPDIAIPMHYGTIIGSKIDAENFFKIVSSKGIKVAILEKEV